MRLMSWLRNLKNPSRRARGTTSCRPRLEALEDRIVLSAFNVTTPLDVVDPSDGLLSLREAVLEANASPGADTITLPAGEYRLSLAGADEDHAATGDLDVRDGLTINGTRADTTYVYAAQLDRVFQVFSAPVNFSRVAIGGGQAGQGGGIYSQDSALEFVHSYVGSNHAGAFNDGADAFGGGIYLGGGSLTAVHTVFTFNGAGSGGGRAWGGGIYNAGGTVTITNSTLEQNYASGYNSGSGRGGGIYNAAGSLTITNSTLLRNSAAGSVGGGRGEAMGGGIYHAGGSLTITNTELNSNTADNATLQGDALGGGLFVAGGTVAITNTTFSSNRAHSGLGKPKGGAIYIAGGSLDITNCKLTSNLAVNGTGGALFIAGGTVCISKNSVFAENSASTDPDIFGPYSLC